MSDPTTIDTTASVSQNDATPAANSAPQPSASEPVEQQPTAPEPSAPAATPAPVSEATSEPINTPAMVTEPLVATAPSVSSQTGSFLDTLVDSWFADHFSDQVFSRESTIWERAYLAKIQLKSLLSATNYPAFDGLVDQWFWDSFSNSEFSHDVSVWNVAYDAKQRLKFLLSSR